MMRLALSVTLLALLISCSGDARREPEAVAGKEAAVPEPQATTEPSRVQSAAPEISHSFSRVQLCKAGIAMVMGREPDAMNALEQAGIVNLSYERTDDKTTWSYRCRVDGARMIWASDTGRWRNHPDDAVLTYEMGQAGELEVTETYSDGSSREESFSAAQLEY